MPRLSLSVAVVLLAGVAAALTWLSAGPRPEAMYLSVPDPALATGAVREHLPPRVEPRREASGFVVGGTNPTSLIRTLTAINGRTIAQLEADMRPEANSEFGSSKGFLGETEKLLEVLATDNDTVLNELKLTHQLIARELNAVAAVVKAAANYHHNRAVEFTYRGRHFRGKMAFWKGYQLSPFRDETETNNDLVLENLDTGKQFKFSLLVPLMIERYGFYEGTGTPYRVDPRRVVEVLDFLKPGAR